MAECANSLDNRKPPRKGSGVRIPAPPLVRAGTRIVQRLPALRFARSAGLISRSTPLETARDWPSVARTWPALDVIAPVVIEIRRRLQPGPLRPDLPDNLPAGGPGHPYLRPYLLGHARRRTAFSRKRPTTPYCRPTAVKTRRDRLNHAVCVACGPACRPRGSHGVLVPFRQNSEAPSPCGASQPNDAAGRPDVNNYGAGRGCLAGYGGPGARSVALAAGACSYRCQARCRAPRLAAPTRPPDFAPT